MALSVHALGKRPDSLWCVLQPSKAYQTVSSWGTTMHWRLQGMSSSLFRSQRSLHTLWHSNSTTSSAFTPPSIARLPFSLHLSFAYHHPNHQPHYELFKHTMSRIFPPRLLLARECLLNLPSYSERRKLPFIGIDRPRLFPPYHLRYSTEYSVNSSTIARITNRRQPTTNLSGICQQKCLDFVRKKRTELLSFGISCEIQISTHTRQQLMGPYS